MRITGFGWCAIWNKRHAQIVPFSDRAIERLKIGGPSGDPQSE